MPITITITQQDKKRMEKQEQSESYKRYLEMTTLPDEWIEFDGMNYKKTLQDIRLKDGTEYTKCYPNAGMFIVFSGSNKQIPCSEVTHVKNRKFELEKNTK